MTAKRVFADTNLFLRYLTNDVPQQADQVEQLLQQAAHGEVTLVTTALAIAEVVWTLASFYQLSRDSIRDCVLAILNTPGVEVEAAPLLIEAATNFAAKNVDFIDAYHAAWMHQQGLRIAYTFDRKHFSRFETLSVKVPGESS